MELERYVDLAYARDSEEPNRWPFLRLRDAQDNFRTATFYPAAKFHLPGRAPLPFPPSLSISRNHFDLEWQGDRRLKNTTMVLEWVPSTSQLGVRAAASATPNQFQRLQQCCALLDPEGTGRFGPRQVEVMLAAAGDFPPLPIST
eukprot:4662364-Prymnesium_polylepis.1